MMMNKSVMGVVTFLALSVHTALAAGGGPKRKALLVGIGGLTSYKIKKRGTWHKRGKTVLSNENNYQLMRNNMRSMEQSCEKLGFHIDEVTDNHSTKGPRRYFGVEELRQKIRDWTKDAKAGDTYLFYYSGHGGTATKETYCKYSKLPEERRNNIEELLREQTVDNLTEDGVHLPGIMCNQIGNAEKGWNKWYPDLKYDLIRPLPKGVTVIIILDCCYSASAAHLKYSLLGPEFQRCVWDEVEKGKRSEALAISFASCGDFEKIIAHTQGSKYIDSHARYREKKPTNTNSTIFTPKIRDMLNNSLTTDTSVAQDMQDLAHKVAHEHKVVHGCDRGIEGECEQTVTVSTNDPSLDLRKMSLRTLLTAGICDENGLKPEYRQKVPEPQPIKLYKAEVTKQPKAAPVLKKEDKDEMTHIVEHDEGLEVVRYRAGTCLLTKGTKLCIDTEEDSQDSSPDEGEAKTYFVQWKLAGKKQSGKMDVALIDRVKPL